jgi:hypothetical protein
MILIMMNEIGEKNQQINKIIYFKYFQFLFLLKQSFFFRINIDKTQIIEQYSHKIQNLYIVMHSCTLFTIESIH